MFTLFNIICYLITIAIDQIPAFGTFTRQLGFVWFDWIGGQNLFTLYLLLTLIPSLAITVRRLHDIGKSGQILLGLILLPFLGLLVGLGAAMFEQVHLLVVLQRITLLIFLIWGIYLLYLLSQNNATENNESGSNLTTGFNKEADLLIDQHKTMSTQNKVNQHTEVIMVKPDPIFNIVMGILVVSFCLCAAYAFYNEIIVWISK